MTPDRWQKIKETLASAMESETTADRTHFLDHACAGDTALRREVDSLLSQSADALDSWADGGGFIGSDSAPSQTAGRRIGPYQLVRELGRGGMGTVWLARRVDDRFEQQVAIKLLKRGTDTEEVLRRFSSERKILARLEHPGIARLFDGGETEDGLPFFVMEFVPGEHLTTYAKKHRLTIPARLALFRKVCAAVQFAHQNLVVHRDLKPGNILVTAEGEPKLLDFGIARLLDEAASDVTALDHRRLTPAYASPEQVRGEPITTASDIYTLGALLYELLTDQSPHAFTSAKPSNTELIRMIAEQDPRRPSLMAEDSATRRHLRGDLDNIVLRAMAREPARRYASAKGLSDDLGRHLTNRPVRARPDTFGYRTGKLMRRNKLGLIAGALLVLALAAGGTATFFEARRAERRFNEVRRLTNSYLFEIHDAIHDLPGATAARQLIVTRALEYLDRLARESAGDPTLQLELADAYLKVGDVQGKPYTPNLGDSAGAVRSYTKATDIAAPLANAETGAHASARRILSQAEESLGGVESRLNHWQEATRAHRRALAMRERLRRDDPAHADEWQRGIVADYLGLGDALVSAQRFQPDQAAQDEALENFRRALPISEKLSADHPQSREDTFLLARICSRIASLLADIGSTQNNPAAYREAALFHERAVALDEAMLRADPSSSALQRNLADGLIALAYLRAFTGEHLEESLGDCQRAAEIMRSLSASDPANAEARQDLSSVYYVTGRIWQKAGDPARAAASYEQCLQILGPLVAAHPENVETSFDLSRVRKSLEEVQVPPAS